MSALNRTRDTYRAKPKLYSTKKALQHSLEHISIIGQIVCEKLQLETRN